MKISGISNGDKLTRVLLMLLVGSCEVTFTIEENDALQLEGNENKDAIMLSLRFAYPHNSPRLELLIWRKIFLDF